MILKQSVLLPLSVSGLWLALSSFGMGQAPNETKVSEYKGSTRSSVPQTPNRPSVVYGLPQTWTSTQVNQVAELLVYQDGEFKMVTQNLNDSKVQEAAREGSKLLANAAQTLRSESSNDEKRAEAKKVMTQYLEAQFDHDQKKRREQLESLEAQVVKLRAQLEKRSQSKEQLIELRLTLMENDASGLSFPQSWTNLPGQEGTWGNNTISNSTPHIYSNNNYGYPQSQPNPGYLQPTNPNAPTTTFIPYIQPVPSNPYPSSGQLPGLPQPPTPR